MLDVSLYFHKLVLVKKLPKEGALRVHCWTLRYIVCVGKHSGSFQNLIFICFKWKLVIGNLLPLVDFFQPSFHSVCMVPCLDYPDIVHNVQNSVCMVPCLDYPDIVKLTMYNIQLYNHFSFPVIQLCLIKNVIDGKVS